MVVGPPTSVSLTGPPPRQMKKTSADCKHARERTGTSSQSELAGPPSQPITEETGPTSQTTPSTSQGTPDPSSGKPEAMDTDVPASSLSAESEDTSEGLLEEEETAESRLARLGPAKGETGGGSGTSAGVSGHVDIFQINVHS